MEDIFFTNSHKVNSNPSESGQENLLSESLLEPEYHPHISVPDGAGDHHDFGGIGGGGATVTTTINNVVTETGSKQPDRFRDLLFLALFLADFISITYLGLVRGLSSLNYHYNTTNTGNDGNNNNRMMESSSYDSTTTSTTSTLHFGGMFAVLLCAIMVALVMTSLLVSLLTRYAHNLIPVTLLLAVASTLLVVLVFLFQQYWAGAVAGAMLALVTGLYARRIWDRIPFASSILQTALTAVQSNGGISLVAYGMVLGQCLYTILWTLAWIGLFVESSAESCNTNNNSSSSSCESNMNAFSALFLLFSYFWTSAVITNSLHCTVSGVVGTWWFAPDLATSFWSAAIRDSWIRSTTYSLGSICLGSLLVAVLQVAHQLLHGIKRSHCGGSGLHVPTAASLVVCVAECLLNFLDRLISYFNKYAFVYIGLYGYDFLESGHRTFQLFQQRGWTVVINDDLVSRVLRLASLVVGLCTAAVGVVLVKWHPTWTQDYANQALVWSFCLCLLVGTAVATTVMGVVASACDTVMVCFAEAPRELEQNHPGLHRTMIQAWEQLGTYEQVYSEER